jgi:hypothetical protein
MSSLGYPHDTPKSIVHLSTVGKSFAWVVHVGSSDDVMHREVLHVGRVSMLDVFVSTVHAVSS